MFTRADRAALREALLDAARRDEAVTAAAVVGSGAGDHEDAWSDIDLAFRLRAGTSLEMAAERWTARLRDREDLVDTLDVRAGDALYRVHLLASSLQVDLSFWPAGTFRATGPAFRLLFGEVNAPPLEPTSDTAAVLAWGWLYALHARSAIARGRLWQAREMLDGLRGRVIALACLRRGLPAEQGRGVDALPPDVLGALEATLPSPAEPVALVRSLRLLGDLLLAEARESGIEVASLQRTLATLVESASSR